MEPDGNLRRPTLTEALWLAAFVVALVVALATLAS